MAYLISEDALDKLLLAARNLEKKAKANPLFALAIADPDIRAGFAALDEVERQTRKAKVPDAPPPTEKIVWTDKSARAQCLWSGARARCIYEFGHPGEHQEDGAPPNL